MMNTSLRLGMALGLLASVLLVSACGGTKTMRTEFAVEGMHCDACSSAITTSLEKVEGVVEVSADHEMGVARVTYDAGRVEVETLKKGIEDLGYTVLGMDTETVTG